MPFKKAKFHIDGGEDVFEGYTDGRTWNGWECPYFPKSEALKIVEWLNRDMSTEAEYVEAADTIVVMMKDQEPEEFTSVDITIEGESIYTYPIGAGCWVWNKYEESEDD